MYKRISLFAGLLLATTVVNALQITASLDQFISRSVTVQGLAAGGGYGRFIVSNVVGDASDEFGDELLEALLADDAEFWAACLEPDELVSVGTSYIFDVDLLRNAPTSPASGPMMAQGETWMERIFDATGYANMNEFVGGSTNGQQFALQAALYEAGYEAKPAASFDITAGSSVVTGGGISPVAIAGYTAAANLPFTPDTNAYALINVGVEGPSGRTIYRGQDFTVFTESIPEPLLPSMLGAGLVALGYTNMRRRRRDNRSMM